MRRFDCLSPEAPLWGPHLLEASAGTGKTFAIEHVFIRLLLERRDPSFLVEQILVVTFTRAAARELKERIRLNMEKALEGLRQRTPSWEYLEPFVGSDKAIALLQEALSFFDRWQIFTIHGFCYRMLQEFAFEARLKFSLPDPDRGKAPPQVLRKTLKDFLFWGILEEDFCPEQASLLVRKHSDPQELEQKLLFPKNSEERPWKELFLRFSEEIEKRALMVDSATILEDWTALLTQYKKKESFEDQVKDFAQALEEPKNPQFFQRLLRKKGTFLKYLSEKNRKIRVKPISLQYPGLFDWAKERLLPLLEEPSQGLLQTLQSQWNPIARRILSEENHLTPDEILSQMDRSLGNPAFLTSVRQKYQAVIIDEFQDTDAVQWKIFSHLFLQAPTLRALYLVGDPKQSIYRFRGADIYTYFEARQTLGEEHLYHLTCNFRSSAALVGSLNALFQREWIYLPRLNESLPYLPVEAGSKDTFDPQDGKGALHVCFAEGKSPWQEVYLPYCLEQIQQLMPWVEDFSSFAILVKDRYQARQARDYLRSYGIPVAAKEETPLGSTYACQALRELFEALERPRDLSRTQKVHLGPFGSLEFSLPFAEWSQEVQEKGFLHLCRILLDSPRSERTLREELIAYDTSFYQDLLQIFEELFLYEQKRGHSFVAATRFFEQLQTLPIEEGGKKRADRGEEGVRILTLHISKGLEFDIVFALGLGFQTPRGEGSLEEEHAEKLRQLYVAMTRAKKRLYVPYLFNEKEDGKKAPSPMQLFSLFFAKEGSFVEALQTLSKQESITYETLTPPFALKPHLPPEVAVIEPAQEVSIRYTSSYLLSFTLLSQKHTPVFSEPLERDGKDLATLPRGKETGIWIHRLFELLFSHPERPWRHLESLHHFVVQQLLSSPLQEWTEVIDQRIQQMWQAPWLGAFSLQELLSEAVQPEVEFLYVEPPHLVKGFIDLVFSFQGGIYWIDWKTNWLGSDYSVESLKKVMTEQDYWLQAALYQEALQRQFAEDLPVKGAFYSFFRGGDPLFLTPDRMTLPEGYARI